MIKNYLNKDGKMFLVKEMGSPSGERFVFIYTLGKQGEWKLKEKTTQKLDKMLLKYNIC